MTIWVDEVMTNYHLNQSRPAHICDWFIVVLKHMASGILINTDSGNFLLPDGTKLLPEPITTCHERDSLALIPG